MHNNHQPNLLLKQHLWGTLIKEKLQKIIQRPGYKNVTNLTS